MTTARRKGAADSDGDDTDSETRCEQQPFGKRNDVDENEDDDGEEEEAGSKAVGW